MTQRLSCRQHLDIVEKEEYLTLVRNQRVAFAQDIAIEHIFTEHRFQTNMSLQAIASIRKIKRLIKLFRKINKN